MKRILLLLLGLCACAMADVEVYSWILPVRIHYADGHARMAWIDFHPGGFYARHLQDAQPRRPLPGKSVLFMNKLGAKDHLIVSDTLHVLPDGYKVLIEKRLPLQGIELVEDASSDSLPALPSWSDNWVDQATGRILLGRRPVFTDLIVLEQDASYNAEHVYCYDSTFTRARIRELYAKGGRRNPALARALREKRVVLIEEISP